MENTIGHMQGFTHQTKSEQKKEKLIQTYKIYNIFEWIMMGLTVVTLIAFLTHEGIDLPADIEVIMHAIGNIPNVIMVPLFIVYVFYTVFCVVLYIRVWPIKEIPKGFTYWWDWVLTFLFTAYELFIFYAILFG